MYDTYEYAHSRLVDTIVRKDGKPIYVVSVREGMVVTYHEIGVDGEKRCKLEEIDIEPVPLGFFNTPRGAIYASRQPRRDDWRQGLRQTSINLKPPRVTYRWSVNDMAEAIRGVSMDIKDAYKESEKTSRMIAFHRYWAVHNGYLHHKWNLVGTIDKDGTPTFYDKYAYLLSRFMEDCCANN